MRVLQAITAVTFLLAIGVLIPAPSNLYSADEAREETNSVPSFLETPVKLEFSVEGEDLGFSVLCVSEDYRLSIDNSDPDGETHFEVGGTVYPYSDDGRVLLNFEAQIHHAALAEGEEFTFSAEGSTLLSPGEKKVLATSPGPGLTVTMQPVE